MQQLAGNLEITEQPTRRRFRAATGWSLVRTWRGAKVKCAAFLSNGLALGGQLAFATDLEVQEDLDGMAVVTADFAVEDGSGSQPTLTASDPVSRVWKLDGNDLEITPFALPAVQVELAKITNTTTRALVISDIRALVDGSPKVLGQDVNDQDILITSDLILRTLAGIPGLNTAVFQNLMD